MNIYIKNIFSSVDKCQANNSKSLTVMPFLGLFFLHLFVSMSASHNIFT